MKINSLVIRDITAYIAATKKSAQLYEAGERRSIVTFLGWLEASDLLQAELVMQGYLLCGGKDIQKVVPAARAVQMTHVYAEMIAQEHDVIAATNGLHVAEIMIANLSIAEDLRLKAVSITNRALLLYMHALASREQTEHVQHCYATELTLNPLHVGMVLAGADCAATDAITAFALAWGRALRTRSAADCDKATVALNEIEIWPISQLQPLRTLYEATS